MPAIKAVLAATFAAPVALMMVAVTTAGSSGSLTTLFPQGAEQSTSPTCENFELGAGVSISGLSPEQAQNAALIVQTAMQKGLGREAAEIAITAALTESTLHTDPGGDNWDSDPEWDWSMGIFQTKLSDQFPEAWEKPGGGKYPDNHRPSIERAKQMALDPQTQANWFFRKLSGEHPSTKSLANFKWRDGKLYKDKPWVAAQKIEQSRIPDAYKRTWEGSKGVTPVEVVDAVLAAGTSTGSTYTSLTTAFPTLEIDGSTNTYIIPNPGNAPLSKSGYPIIRKDTSPQLATVTTNGQLVPVAKWASSVFEDLFTRWQKNPVLGDGRLSLTTTGSTVTGWVSRATEDNLKNTDFYAGTAVRVQKDKVTPRKPLTEEEKAAIQSILSEMGGLLVWGGESDPTLFYVTPKVGPRQLDGWNATFSNVATPPYFFVGDSIGESIDNDLESLIPQMSTKSRSGRGIDEGIRILDTAPEAKNANAWVIQLGTNNSNDPVRMARYIDRVMKLADNRRVYWVNSYRPTTFKYGDTNENNAVLAEKASTYENLTVVDWYTEAINNPAWFAGDETGGYIHPNPAGQDALKNLIRSALGGNGSSESAMSVLCGGGSGVIGNAEFVDGIPVDGSKITTNYTVQVPGAAAALRRANSFVGNPPCGDGKCYQLCGRLSARVYGQPYSGFDDARTQWFASVSRGLATPATVKGERNPNALNIPPGALVYWDVGDYGHVATYLGDGYVLSNWDGPKGYGVYKVAFDTMNSSYGGYYGWSLPPW